MVGKYHMGTEWLLMHMHSLIEKKIVLLLWAHAEYSSVYIKGDSYV